MNLIAAHYTRLGGPYVFLFFFFYTNTYVQSQTCTVSTIVQVHTRVCVCSVTYCEHERFIHISRAPMRIGAKNFNIQQNIPTEVASQFERACYLL